MHYKFAELVICGDQCCFHSMIDAICCSSADQPTGQPRSADRVLNLFLLLTDICTGQMHLLKLLELINRRRAKAAFAAYTDRELPQLKLDRPGLKQSQYKDLLWKQWQKAPENPFNRAVA